MPRTFNCPGCGAPLQYSGAANTVPCPYCGSSVIVPEDLRRRNLETTGRPTDQPVAGISPEQMSEIKRLLEDGRKIEAIKIYRQATMLGLKEAKEAVEAIEAADPGLKNHLPGVNPASAKIRGKIVTVLAGLFFLGIASIFPLVFIPMGIGSWQNQVYGAAFFAFFGAILWAVIWGGIGVLILKSARNDT